MAKNSLVTDIILSALAASSGWFLKYSSLRFSIFLALSPNRETSSVLGVASCVVLSSILSSLLQEAIKNPPHNSNRCKAIFFVIFSFILKNLVVKHFGNSKKALLFRAVRAT